MYNYINIILDEIELYFHPEFQKLFVKRLIDEINKLKLTEIKGINILIISHSPFILSDIPKQNVLFLERGKPVSLDRFKNTNTFAANQPINTNWFDEITRTGSYTQNNISISGASENIKYFFSVGNYEEQAILKGLNYGRTTFRNNNEFKISKKVTI